jgi:hypothetical protein
MLRFMFHILVGATGRSPLQGLPPSGGRLRGGPTETIIDATHCVSEKGHPDNTVLFRLPPFARCGQEKWIHSQIADKTKSAKNVKIAPFFVNFSLRFLFQQQTKSESPAPTHYPESIIVTNQYFWHVNC